jgi:hypothetical protein
VPLELYADECVDARIVAGLRRRGIDVVTAGAQQLLRASDSEQRDRATKLGRVFMTADQDFLAADYELPYGLIFIMPTASPGYAVRRIADIATILDPADMERPLPIFPFPGGRRFHFRDPAGNELAVWSER